MVKFQQMHSKSGGYRLILAIHMFRTSVYLTITNNFIYAVKMISLKIALRYLNCIKTGYLLMNFCYVSSCWNLN